MDVKVGEEESMDKDVMNKAVGIPARVVQTAEAIIEEEGSKKGKSLPE